MRPIIMLVDDEMEILDILAQLLDDEGYTVVTFSDGRAALDYARIQPPSLALVDLMMPLMDGRDLILHLRAEHIIHFPIVVMSASTNSDLIRDLPIQDYMSKPFDLDDVVARVRTLTSTVPARQFNASAASTM
jgi:DNA-binding response OmpR family regulator